MRRLFQRYSLWTQQRPLAAIPVSTGCILGVGDGLCQQLERAGYLKPKVKSQASQLPGEQPWWDLKRTARTVVYGWLWIGPSCALWYTWCLPRLVPMHKPTIRLVLAKVILDETLLSWWSYCSFLYGMTRLEGEDHQSGVDKVQKDFWKIYKADLMVWPWVQFANFWWVSPHLQSLVVSSCSIVWGCYLSSVQNG